MDLSLPLNETAQLADPIAQLGAPGAPFELRTIEIDGAPQRIFCNAPQTLCTIYQTTNQFAARTLIAHDGAHLTYGEVMHKAAALSRFLADHGGSGKGTRIAIAMHNRPEWMIAFIAITALGATAVLVNSRGTATEIAAALADSDSTLVIADEQRAQLIAKQDATRHLIVVREAGAENTLPTQWSAFTAALAGWQSAEFTPVAMQPDDEAIVMFTSGTTGGSKAVLHNQRGLMTGIMNIQYSMAVIGARIASRLDPAALAQIPAPQPCTLLSVPLFHASGCYSIFLSNFLRGGKIVILPKWNATLALDLIERENVISFSGAPAMLWDLLRADRSGRDLRGLRSIGVGGQALQPQLLREIVAAFPGALLGGGYGMTEANGSVCLIVGEDLLARPSSSGRVIATADLKLIDEDGTEISNGATGEICLRGAMIMRGYCKRPAETAEVLQDGWLRTGDLGYLDADAYLHVIDRKKDIVISGGENISCTEVEGVIAEHPAVLEAAAFGIADERLGEILVIAVVLTNDRSLVTYTLKSHVATRLAIYKVPRAIMICPQLPRNAVGKVNRNELRRQFLEQT